MCGEKPFVTGRSTVLMGSPPRMRGKGCCTHLVIFVDGITPAYAGKRLLHTSGDIRGWDHPRVCGEKQRTLAVQDEPQGSPPRMRGKVAGLCGHAGGHGITPAYAGKSRARRTASSTSWDHPRVCREKYGRFDRRCSRAGSPPRVRGKEKHHPFLPEQHGITPACAGKRTFVPLVKSTA